MCAIKALRLSLPLWEVQAFKPIFLNRMQKYLPDNHGLTKAHLQEGEEEEEEARLVQEVHMESGDFITHPCLVFLLDSVKHLEVRLEVMMGESGPGGGDGNDSDNTPDDEPPPGKRPGRSGFPPDDGYNFGDELSGQCRKPVNINKWAKPLPRLDLPPRIHTCSESK